MEVYVEARVTYLCTLSAEDEEKVRQRAKEKDLEFPEAIQQLYAMGKISLYDNFVETDCETGRILLVAMGDK